MEFIYLFVFDGVEWEDIIPLVSLEESISISLKYPKARVEIFSKNNNDFGFIPTYNYYQNGKYICNLINS